MKKLISLTTIIVMLLIATQSNAQVSFGVKAGLNFSGMTVSGYEGVTSSSRTAFQFGAMLDFSLSKSFSLETGLNLNSKGANFEYDDLHPGLTVLTKPVTLNLATTLSPLYLEVPINAIYKVNIKPVKICFYGGPYFAFGVGGSRTAEYSATGLAGTGFTLQQLLDAHNATYNTDYKNQSNAIKYGSVDGDDMKAFDMGLNFGAGVEYFNFIFRVQYTFSLLNLNPTTANNEVLKNNGLSLSVGYFFRQK